MIQWLKSHKTTEVKASDATFLSTKESSGGLK
jgi:hypothetical protein